MQPRDISSSQLWLEDLDESVSSLESFSEDASSSSSSSSTSFSEDVVFPDNADNDNDNDNDDENDTPLLVGRRPTKKKPLPRRRATFHHGDYNQHHEQSLACLKPMMGGRSPAVSGQRLTVTNNNTTNNNVNSNAKSKARRSQSFDQAVDDELLASSPMRKFRISQAASNDCDLSKSRSCHNLTQRRPRRSETAAKLTSNDGRRIRQLQLGRRHTTVATTTTAASTTTSASMVLSAAASASLSTTAGGDGESPTDDNNDNGGSKTTNLLLLVQEVELLRSCTMVELLPQVSQHTLHSNCDSAVASKDTRWSSSSTPQNTKHHAARLSSSLASTTAHHPSPSSSNVRCPRRQKSNELLLDDDPSSFRQSDIRNETDNKSCTNNCSSPAEQVVSRSANAIMKSDTMTAGCAKDMRSSGTNCNTIIQSATMVTTATINKATAIKRPQIPHRQKHLTIQGALREKAAAAAAMEEKARTRPTLPSFGRSSSDSLVNLMYQPNHSSNDKTKHQHNKKTIGTAMKLPGRSQSSPSPASNNDHCICGIPYSSLAEAIAKELDDDSLLEAPGGGDECCATACNNSSDQQHPMKTTFEEKNWRCSSERDLRLKKPTRRASLAA